MSELDMLTERTNFYKSAKAYVWNEPHDPREIADAGLKELAILREGAELLKQSEWSLDDDPDSYCWYCEHYKHQGHAPDCKLDAWLKKANV